jgi:hypothetical protein
LSVGTHDDGYHELAHYWRFKAIQDSVANKTLGVANDVYPVIASPKAHLDKYSPSQLAANEAFNGTYSRMLDSLERSCRANTPMCIPPPPG